MNFESMRLRALHKTVGVLLLAAAGAAQAQEVTQLDTMNVYRTHIRVRHTDVNGASTGGNTTSYQSTPAAFGGTPYSIAVSARRPTTTGSEAEEHVAVNKNFPNFIFTSISDFSLPGGVNCSKYSYSSDNGITWTQSFVPLNGSNMRITGDGLAWPYNSDPVQAIANDGTIYFSNLYFGTGNDGGLYVSRSSVANPIISAANTFGVQVHPDPNSTVFEDKQWIAVDNSNSLNAGNVYVSWTRFPSTGNMIMFSKSTNQAQTWSTPIQISDAAFNGAVQGSQIAVGPDGTIYVVYHVAYVGSKGIQWMTKSTDGGNTWSPKIQVSPQYNEPTFNSTYRKNSFCQLAVSPTGFIGVCYPDQPSKTAGAEARFVRSTTAGGSTFTAPITVNDVSAGNQFFPTLACDELGHWHMKWVDTRNNSRSTSSLDAYASRSTDNGTTWSANTRLSASSWSVGSSSFIGDYSGNAAAGGYAHPVWTTGANGATTGLFTITLQ